MALMVYPKAEDVTSLKAMQLKSLRMQEDKGEERFTNGLLDTNLNLARYVSLYKNNIPT